jgi:glycosyltransferase involved in cell wall biosynthesis
MVSVILTVYARPENLDLQLKHINNQSIKPDEIIIVVDFNADINFNFEKYQDYKVVSFNQNMGVWARFSIALLSKSKYVCVFDDDTIPGKKWFENCIKTLDKVDGLLGTVGIKFKSGALDYSYSDRVGWPSANDKIEQVDIVGHSWFFKRELIEKFWNNTSDHHKYKKSGEDMHFSYIISKELGLKTFVPPHPQNMTELWGSLPEFAQDLGSDSNALSLQTFSNLRMSNYLKKIREDNFKYVSEITSKETIYESQTDSKVKFYLNNMKFIIKSLIKKIIKS